jgi:molybdopterin/thiamine biosynthesis adenylyltransferase
MDLSYQTLFRRNYGIFSDDEQSRIRQNRVVIIGDSGTGETISTILSRSGFEEFIVAGQDNYVPSDMNRQIGCFIDTVGKNKAAHIKDTILSINPQAKVTIFPHLPEEEVLDQLIAQGDIIIPAVDDLAYSVLIFRAARRLGKSAILCLPSGSMGWVSVFRNNTPTLEEMLGIPVLNYKGLRDVMHTVEYQCAQYNYITSGDWRVEWFFEYFKGNRPLALICPAEWMLASLAALEALKVATGKWAPMEAPRCWYLRKGKVSAARFSIFLRYHRKVGWLIFRPGEGWRLHKLTHRLWKRFFDYHRSRQ